MKWTGRLWWACLYITGFIKEATPEDYNLRRLVDEMTQEKASLISQHQSQTESLLTRIHALQEELRMARSESAVQGYEISLLSEAIERDRRRVEAETARSVEQIAISTGTRGTNGSR